MSATKQLGPNVVKIENGIENGIESEIESEIENGIENEIESQKPYKRIKPSQANIHKNQRKSLKSTKSKAHVHGSHQNLLKSLKSTKLRLRVRLRMGLRMIGL